MHKYHIIWTMPNGIYTDTIHEWAWVIDKVSIPLKPGESYTIFVCEMAGCNDARHHARLWENAFQARISEVTRRRDQKKET
jgi:hypothetical protein